MKPDIKKKIESPNPRKVTELRLENGRLKKLPFELENFPRLKFLNMFNNHLEDLPEFFRDFDKLENLNLSSNKFVLYPEQINSCKNIKYLSLKGNRISSLIGIEELSNKLEKLDLSSNKLEVLRTDFTSFSELKHFDLSDNGIKKFPRSILHANLKSLNLSSNQIKIIPSEISKLSNITALDLSFNSISVIPEEICELKELRKLNLTGNQITELPKSFGKLSKLVELNLNGNPIGDVPLEISQQGLKAVLNYYLHLGVSVRLNEAKLLIVGQGAVGKTYLMNKLIYGKSDETKTTEGIDIVKWNLNIPDQDGEQTVRLNAWDFGGQEIYHSTHQFFLTKRSIYLFVWEARRDSSLLTFDYWLNIIQVLSNGSPVIVVLNKIDERVKEIDEKSLMEKFPNIKTFVSVSALNGTNIDALIEKIKSNVISLPHIGDKLPKVWSEVREDLDEILENYISYERYVGICNKYGLNKEQSKHLSRYFHDLGVFLHFQDNSVLKPVLFLKPEWATNFVYKILDLKDVVKNFGEFDGDLLERDLGEYNSQQISYVTELMKKFELCFEINNKYIIPELLNPVQPDIDWEMDGGIGLVYKYDFMPAGILPRLIVRLKDLILGKKYWKTGVYVKLGETIGSVVNNQFSRTISIEVSGDSKAVLLGIIKRELDYINGTLNYPYHEIKINCNCSICEKSNSPHMFNYNYLEKAKNNGVKTVMCEESILQVNLSKLIGPYEIKTLVEKDDFRYNSSDLTYDIIEITTRILERKYNKEIEDLITDYFTDNLRSKGYNITDQTRSGRSKVQSGELDIMVRNLRHMPIAIIEAMKLNSFGLGNKTIIEHLNKMLIDYDTNGLSRNFMLIYSKSDNFSDFWLKYKDYLENLTNHHLYDSRAELTSFNVNSEISQRSNVKVFTSQHLRSSGSTEVFHILINMK